MEDKNKDGIFHPCFAIKKILNQIEKTRNTNNNFYDSD